MVENIFCINLDDSPCGDCQYEQYEQQQKRVISNQERFIMARVR